MRVKYRGPLFVSMLAVVSLGATSRTVPLVEAVKTADVKTVRALLQQRVPVNAPEVDGTTALHWAVHRSDLESVDLLIRAGANVAATNRYGVTPLSLACENGNAAIIERLVQAGANINAALPGGETPLMTATRTGEAGAVQVLLAHGADVNARESTRGQTALMWAAANGHAAVIQALVEQGADVHARATGPASAKDVEKRDANTTGVLLFLGVSAPRLDAFTPLLFAVRQGHLDATLALLEAGANVNDTAPDGTSALAMAIANAHFELAAFLLEHGADPNAAAQGWTPLHQLARTRKPNIGWLFPAVTTGSLNSLALAEKLVARGANVNARQTKAVDDGYRQNPRIGATPFWLAARYVDVELMRFLLSHGADPLLSVANDTTPLMAAAGIGMLYLSEDTGTDEDTLAAVKLCLQRGAGDVNAVNGDGETALHGAAKRGVSTVVQLLVANGARLDAKDKRGLTPLMVADEALYNQQPETAALLRQLMTARSIPIEAPPAVVAPRSR